MYQHIVYIIIATPNNNNPTTPIGFKESVAPLKDGVDVGEGMVVRFPEAVLVLKAAEAVRVVVNAGEVWLAVVEAETETVEESPDIILISKYRIKISRGELGHTGCWCSTRTTRLRSTKSAYDWSNSIASSLL